MTEKKVKQNQFITSDLALAAALITSGCQLSDLDKTNPKRMGFIFIKTGDSFDRLVEDFFSDKARVNPRKYFEDIKMLKNRIYTQ